MLYNPRGGNPHVITGGYFSLNFKCECKITEEMGTIPAKGLPRILLSGRMEKQAISVSIFNSSSKFLEEVMDLLNLFQPN